MFLLLIIPFLLPLLLLLNEIIRSLLSLLLSLTKSSTSLSSAGYDSIYAYRSHLQGRRTVLYLAVLGDNGHNFSVKKHIQNYETRVLNRPEFGKLRKVWVEKWGYVGLRESPNFHARQHVRLWSGCGVVTEEVLMTEILPELSKDLDDSKPQWEDVIVRNFVYSHSPATMHTLRIFRTHHGYMDGISNLLMLANTQSNPASDFPWVINPLEPRPSSPTPLFYLASLLCFPFVAVEHIWKKATERTTWVPESYTGRTVHGWSEKIEVGVVQRIRDVSKCSMPAILTSVLISALRRFREEFPVKGKKEEDAIVLGLVTALLPYRSLNLQNNHSILRCCLDSRDMPRRARLMSVDKELNRLSKQPHVWLNHLLPTIYGRLPVTFSNLFTGMMTGDGVVSNFPATRDKVELWGSEVEEMAGWVPLLTRVGFACVTLRYATGLRYCLNADESVMSKEQMQFLSRVIVEEVVNLEKEIGQRTGSLVVGRFLVCPVESGDENNNVTGVEVEEKEKSRKERIHGVLRKIVHSFDKIKGV